MIRKIAGEFITEELQIVSGGVDVVDAPTADEFFRSYIRKNRPVLLRSMVTAWPAMNRWSFDFFRRLGADHIVHLEEGNVMQEETHFRRESFADYMRQLMDEPDHNGRTPYLSLFNVFEAFPELHDDVDFTLLNQRKSIRAASRGSGRLEP